MTECESDPSVRKNKNKIDLPLLCGVIALRSRGALISAGVGAGGGTGQQMGWLTGEGYWRTEVQKKKQTNKTMALEWRQIISRPRIRD